MLGSKTIPDRPPPPKLYSFALADGDDEDADAAATVADDAAVTSSDMACLGVVLEILLVMFKHTNHSLIHAAYQ